MNLPENLSYTAEHEWLRIDGDTAIIGITEYAADKLGDIVYADLPAAGDSISAGATVGELESTKSVGEIYAPVSGEVVESNSAVADDPAIVNSDPYGDGWLVSVRFTELPALLTAEQYRAIIGGDGA